jgi:hypothetical protein
MAPMTSLRRLVSVVGVLCVVGVLTAVTSGASSARTVDERCLSAAPLPAAALAAATDPAGCSLVGRTVRAHGVSVVVPPVGRTIAAEGVSRDGDVVGLTVTNTGHGVTASSGRVHAAGAGAAVRTSSPPACQDRTFHLEGHHWKTSFRYHLALAKMPGRYHAKTVVRQVKAANHHLRTGDNTCGRARIDTPGATYLGRTSSHPNIRVSGSTVGCGSYNTTNVVGFADLPGNLLGWTCFWWVDGGRIDAADVVMDTGPALTTHLPDACTDRWDFEGAVTHEMGHVYGLGHTGSGHANLTMQHVLRPCSTYARTLGLGDWLGLKKMYGVR